MMSKFLLLSVLALQGCAGRGPAIGPVNPGTLNEAALFSRAEVSRTDVCYTGQNPETGERTGKTGLRKLSDEGLECLGALRLNSLERNSQIPTSDIAFLKDASATLIARMLATDGQVFDLPIERVVGADGAFTDGKQNTFTLDLNAKGNIVSGPKRPATPVVRQTPRPSPGQPGQPTKPAATEPTLAQRPTDGKPSTQEPAVTHIPSLSQTPEAVPGKCYDSYGDSHEPNVPYPSASGDWECTGLFTTGTQIIVSQFRHLQTGADFFVVTNIYNVNGGEVYKGTAEFWLKTHGYPVTPYR